MDKNTTFNFAEIYKICKASLSELLVSQIIFPGITNRKDVYTSANILDHEKYQEKVDPEFVNDLSKYFAKHVFESVGCDLEDEIPFEKISAVVNDSENEQNGILKMLCGIDRFVDPAQGYI